MDKFHRDLAQGHKYEKRCLDYLDYDTVEHKQGKFSEYDLTITKDGKKTTIEVKSDRQASQTGNLAIEYECNGKPSGINKTTADYWIYFIVYPDREECYKIKTTTLRKITEKCKQVSGGDGNRSRLYLVSKTKLCKYLINLFQNKNLTTNIKAMTDNHKDKTDEVKPLSFTERLIMEFKEQHQNSFNMPDVRRIITEFSKKEYEKKKKNTDEMPFGKYKFKKVEDVAKFDKQYLKWLTKQDMMTNYEELKQEINKHIN
jgi:uncharacterized protein (DUF3820 family)